MRKTIVILLVSCIFLGSCNLFSLEKTSAQTTSKTLYVGGNGEGYYDTIWDAINASSDGDTVFVYNGIYEENPIIRKKISLIGEDKEKTIIQGRCGWNVVEIKVDGVKISGFTIKNIGGLSSYKKFSGLDVESSGNTITDNIIQLNLVQYKTFLYGYKTNSENYGIYLHSDNVGNNYIENNFITTDNLDYGVGIWVKSQNDNNIISNNEFLKNEYAMLISECDNNVISGNTFLKNEYGGIRLDESSYNNIYDNTFSNEDFVSLNGHTGIIIFFGSHNMINDNFFDKVDLATSSTNDIITGNTFISSGISIGGEDIESWNTHTIENNLVDGRPIYYFKNDHTGRIAPYDAGTVILANCSNFIIENLNIINVSSGIQIGYTSNTLIKNNILTNNSNSLYLWNSSNNIIDYNYIKNSKWAGISLGGCENNIVSNNTISNQDFVNDSFSGVNLMGSNNNIICKNTIENTDFGLMMYDSSNNEISEDNIFSDNKKDIYYDPTPNIHVFNLSDDDDDDDQIKAAASEPENQIPGFEFLSVICVITVLLFWKRKKKDSVIF